MKPIHMQSICISLLLFFSLTSLSAKQILSDLNFGSGKWVVIGVPVHNYKSLPVQEELGTFIMKDLNLMKSIQKSWDLDLTFEDKCDYHYALKFYQNSQLIRTVKLNLHCGYLTFDGLSYDFDPARFGEFKQSATAIDWSRISFGDLDLLKLAIRTLDDKPNVFWYEDVYPYTYSGYFMIGVNNLPWNASLDSLDQEVYQGIRLTTNQDNFYLKKYFHVVRGDKLFVRYLVNCEEQFAQTFPVENQYLKWRSHLQGTDSVRVVAIGINQSRYQRIMRQSNNE